MLFNSFFCNYFQNKYLFKIKVRNYLKSNLFTKIKIHINNISTVVVLFHSKRIVLVWQNYIIIVTEKNSDVENDKLSLITIISMALTYFMIGKPEENNTNYIRSGRTAAGRCDTVQLI